MSLSQATEVEVLDERGKRYTFRHADGRVRIVPPGTLKVTTVDVQDLRAMVETFAPLSVGELVERLSASLMAPGDAITLTKKPDGGVIVTTTSKLTEPW